MLNQKAFGTETAPVDHLNDIEFERVCQLLADEYGLDMSSKRVLLECRLSREQERLGLSSFTKYLDLVESNSDPNVRARFIDLVTTHYTYFMRESKQFDFLRTTVFPELERLRPHRTWNILCAGCSTGDECYSVSMVVEDYGQTHRIPHVRITGIDVSEPAIAEARVATYPAARVDRVPARWLTSYFVRKDNTYTVADRVRKRVSFLSGNLSNPNVLKQTYDLILCRNVIIYFNDEARMQALSTLHRHLASSCYLVLGHAEIVRERSMFAYRGHSIYQKQAEATIS